MTTVPRLTLARARELFTYDPEIGVLTRKVSRRGRAWVGAVAGSPQRRGRTTYLRVDIDGAHYYVHRVAWLVDHGQWPEVIDHINGDGLDNRLDNLRAATLTVNARNQTRHRDNRSGVTGVCWDPQCNKWRAGVHVYGKKQLHLGLFTTVWQAAAHRKLADWYLGFSRNHGRGSETEQWT